MAATCLVYASNLQRNVPTLIGREGNVSAAVPEYVLVGVFLH